MTAGSSLKDVYFFSQVGKIKAVTRTGNYTKNHKTGLKAQRKQSGTPPALPRILHKHQLRSAESLRFLLGRLDVLHLLKNLWSAFSRLYSPFKFPEPQNSIRKKSVFLFCWLVSKRGSSRKRRRPRTELRAAASSMLAPTAAPLCSEQTSCSRPSHQPPEGRRLLASHFLFPVQSADSQKQGGPQEGLCAPASEPSTQEVLLQRSSAATDSSLPPSGSCSKHQKKLLCFSATSLLVSQTQ